MSWKVWTQLLVPIVAFWGVYHFTGNLYTATAVLMVATLFSLILEWFFSKRIGKGALFSAALVFILGGATLIFKSPQFIQAKPSILGLGMAVALLFWPRFHEGKTLIQWIIEQPKGDAQKEELSLSKKQYQTLNLIWVGYSFSLALINLVVWQLLSENAWVFFKAWGILSLSLVFFVLSGTYIWASLKSDAKKDKSNLVQKD